MSPPDILVRICADTKQDLTRRQATISREQIVNLARTAGPPRGFGAALKRATLQGGCGVVAEIKKSSPSGGVIRNDLDPAAIARQYQAGGATCLSVLTEERYFSGSDVHLRLARRACTLPVLRKDFILDPWQVYESRAMGADCILLIMAVLENDQALELEHVAQTLDLDVVIEVHDRAELDRALGLHSNLIGINNRNLKTQQIDLRNTVDLAPHVPPDKFLISESGIRDQADIDFLAQTGVRCFLVGESLLRQPDPQAAMQALLGQSGQCTTN